MPGKLERQMKKLGRDFVGALKAAHSRTGLPGLIAEVKKGSPTRGILREDFYPVEIARAYEKGGAACLSVLTDEKYFKGSFENLEAIRSAGVKCPVLCKEFVIDAWQIYYARIKGADGIRLIAAVLPDLDIRYMVKICKMLGLAALVEVHDEREMDRVLGIEGIELIGINNRNLGKFLPSITVLISSSAAPIFRAFEPNRLVHNSSSSIGDQIPEKGRGGRCVESEGMGSWKVPKRSRCESRHKNKAKTAYGSAVALFRLQNEGNTPRNILEEIIWQYKLIPQFCLEIKSVIKVRLPSMDEKVALVPWADMLNHSCEVETFLDYDRSSHGVVFTTDRAYQPGEQCYPIQITGWPLELMAYAYLAVSPPSMSPQFEEMAAAASNKSTTKKDLRYPEIEEKALQFILDSCESSISKYSKFLQASGSMDLDVTSPKQLNRRVFMKQLAVDLCTSEQRILFRAQYKIEKALCKLGSDTIDDVAFNPVFRHEANGSPIVKQKLSSIGRSRQGKCSQRSLSKVWPSEAVIGGAKIRSENRQDTDIGGDKKYHMILVQNLEKELSSSTVLEFIHKQTSIASQVYIFPSLPWELYTNGVIVLDCRKDLEQLFGFLDNPNHFVVSSNGRVVLRSSLHTTACRPWVAAEKMSMNDHWTVMLESPKKLRNRSGGGFINALKLVCFGSEEYKRAKELRDLFLQFIAHQQGLYKKLCMEERSIAFSSNQLVQLPDKS
ncbi:SET domain - like 7 [Theobroma cacao]|nr:SET domain - like 7 [Theobroma cacao]